MDATGKLRSLARQMTYVEGGAAAHSVGSARAAQRKVVTFPTSAGLNAAH
jgi:hypothetical protein